MNIFVFGFDSDYAKLDIKSLHNYVNINRINLPYVIKFTLLRLRHISPSITAKLLAIYLSMYIKHEDSLLLLDDSILSVIASKVENEKVSKRILIMRNTYQYSNIELDLLNVTYYTFDYLDSKRLNIKLYRQYCSGYDYIVERSSNSIGYESKCDFYFLGLDKGRASLLKKLKRRLSLYSCDIRVKKRPKGNIKYFNLLLRLNEYTYQPYESHLDSLLSSRVVIDIVKPGQTGLTMRTLEAIISNKKIITNNQSIIKEKFYHSNNILIIDDELKITDDEINQFLNSVYINVSAEVKALYSPGKVLSEIIKNEII